ncbi:MAG: hypothetical protein ACOC9W_05265, partial [Persicimonas sp.]
AQHDLAVEVLEQNLDLLELLAQALLEFESLDANEIDLLMEQESLTGVRELREQQERDDKSREKSPQEDVVSDTEQEDKAPQGTLGDLTPSPNS